ncbi:MAG: DUF3021 domain-containing protein [Clostridiales bacterium]|nr:DUF3021 domain-containing protein [Clostridiales bacterium]
MKKKLLFRCLMGAPIGVTVSLIITIFFSLCLGGREYNPAPPELVELCGNTVIAVIVQLLCSLAIGAASAGSSVIFEIEKWSLLKQTLVHFGVIAVPFFGLGYLLNWVSHQPIGALAFVGCFVAVYFIMWISIYFSIKSKVKKMNMQLREIRQDDIK